MFDHSFPACAFFFFSNGDQLARTNSTFQARISPQWLSELRRLWPNVPNKLRTSLFPGSFPYYVWTAASSDNSDFAGSRVYACLGVTCHLHFWQNGQGLLRATAVTRDGTDTERTKIMQKQRQRKKALFSEKEIRLLSGSRTPSFCHRMW